MKALSLKQPWAWAVLHTDKDVENRSWYCGYRGPLVIHGSKNWDQKGYEFLVYRMDVWVPEKERHVFGALQGIVEMVDCVDRCDSRWFFGDWGFVFEDPREFKRPIPWRGQQMLFDVPDSIIKRALEGVIK